LAHRAATPRTKALCLATQRFGLFANISSLSASQRNAAPCHVVHRNVSRCNATQRTGSLDHFSTLRPSALLCAPHGVVTTRHAMQRFICQFLCGAALLVETTRGSTQCGATQLSASIHCGASRRFAPQRIAPLRIATQRTV
jgi:hypothetical protein